MISVTKAQQVIPYEIATQRLIAENIPANRSEHLLATLPAIHNFREIYYSEADVGDLIKQIKRIKRDYVNYSQAAKKLGCSRSTATKIIQKNQESIASVNYPLVSTKSFRFADITKIAPHFSSKTRKMIKGKHGMFTPMMAVTVSGKKGRILVKKGIWYVEIDTKEIPLKSTLSNVKPLYSVSQLDTKIKRFGIEARVNFKLDQLRDQDVGRFFDFLIQYIPQTSYRISEVDRNDKFLLNILDTTFTLNRDFVSRSEMTEFQKKFNKLFTNKCKMLIYDVDNLGVGVEFENRQPATYVSVSDETRAKAKQIAKARHMRLNNLYSEIIEEYFENRKEDELF